MVFGDTTQKNPPFFFPDLFILMTMEQILVELSLGTNFYELS